MTEPEQTQPVPFSLEGEKLEGRLGDTLAAALLRNGVTTFTRSIKYHRPRGPFCFAGSCGQCLVRVDGVPSLPACQVELKPGMACERQNAPLGLIEQDLFRAVDFIYPGGLDHHHLMIQSRLLGRVALEVARRLAGLGTLPDENQPPLPGSLREVPLVIIGAGPSGLAAARGALETGIHGLRPLVLEREGALGGASKLWAGASDRMDPKHRRRAEETQDANGSRVHPPPVAAELPRGAQLLAGAEVIGLYADESASGSALLAVRQGETLLAVRARRVIVATGGASQPWPFPGNDRPGVYAARGLLALHHGSNVRVGEGKPLVVVGSGPELARCARSLIARGYSLAGMVAIDNQSIPQELLPAGVELLRGEVTRVRGRPVAEIQVRVAKPGSSETTLRKLRCGAVAIALPPAPLYDLASSVGARAELSMDYGGFPLVIDANGRTSIPWLFACGTAAMMDPSIKAAVAARAGALAAREASALDAAADATL